MVFENDQWGVRQMRMETNMRGFARLRSVIQQQNEIKQSLIEQCQEMATLVADTIGTIKCLPHGYRVVEIEDKVLVLRHDNNGIPHIDWGYEECKRFAADIAHGFLNEIADTIEVQLEADRQLLKSAIKSD